MIKWLLGGFFSWSCWKSLQLCDCKAYWLLDFPTRMYDKAYSGLSSLGHITNCWRWNNKLDFFLIYILFGKDNKKYYLLRKKRMTIRKLIIGVLLAVRSDGKKLVQLSVKSKAHVEAVMSRSETKARCMQNVNIRNGTDAQELIDDPDANAIYTTPPSSHATRHYVRRQVFVLCWETHCKLWRLCSTNRIKNKQVCRVLLLIIADTALFSGSA